MRRRSLIPFLLVFVIVLAGCGGAAVQPSTEPSTSTGGVFQMALPRLVVDVDAEGNPSVLGVSPAVLSAFGVDTSAMKVPPETVKMMTDGGVQHLEISSVGDRIMLFANGKPLPMLTWDAQSLPRAMDLATVFMDVQNAAVIKNLLPLITRLGLDIVLRFPTGGAAEIPLPDPNVAKQYKPTPGTDPASMVVKFEVNFNDQGQAGAFGLTPEDMTSMGMTPVTLPAETFKKIQANNIQHIEFRSTPEGTTIYVNNEPLPTLTWDPQVLANLMELVKQVQPDSPILPLLEQFVPYLDRGDIDIMLNFPAAAGQAAIEAQWH
jgi:hypothetical protein